MMTRIVIVSARVGAGHDGAAYALAERLGHHDVEVLDFLDLLPRSLGQRLCGFYHRQLELAPRSWDWTLCALETAGPAWLARRAATLACDRLRAALGHGPELAISTYPLATHALGTLRTQGVLTAPLAVYLTDPSVHRLCVSGIADLHLAPNREAGAQALAWGARQVEVAPPLVRARFRPATTAERSRARQEFGLPPAGRLALVVAGSWGVGQVAETARDVAVSGAAVPVVVCGRNAALRDQLLAVGHPHVFGWVEDMPRLMHAVDAVVQNAGGLTTFEALAAGLPVFTYRCLPGHGRANAGVLDRIGTVPWIRSADGLTTALAAATPSAVATLPAGDPIPLLEKLLDVA